MRVTRSSPVFVVGAGPNGLTAAIELARAGREVVVLEAASTPGGGTRTAELIEPGTRHDVCSAIHPLGVASEALRRLHLADHGLRWIEPDIELAHVLDDGGAAALERSLDATVDGLGPAGAAWRRAMTPLTDAGLDLVDDLLSPLSLPRHPIHLARYGVAGLQPATTYARHFDDDTVGGLFAGLAAHAMLPLRAPITTGYGLMLGLLGHLVGWPLARGGSQRISDALVSLLTAEGGSIECDHPVTSLDELPTGATVLLDVTPTQLIAIAGDRLPSRYRRRLERYRHGPGAFKLDYVLSEPIPWTSPVARRAGTVHVGGAFTEVATAEAEVTAGRHPARPFVLVSEPTRFDPTRSTTGRSVAWAYCHVPNGSSVDMTERVEAQIERFAPGFRDVIVDRRAMRPAQLEAYNANYVGGDIAAGAGDLRQFVARPTLGLHPWRTPLDGIYLCSAATPPGPGVHGMCGLHAARTALRDGW